MAWDETAGVEALDFLLLDHFADAFQAQHGKDPRTNSRALAKLRKQVGPPHDHGVPVGQMLDIMLGGPGLPGQCIRRPGSWPACIRPFW